jgi:hypothetical protein
MQRKSAAGGNGISVAETPHKHCSNCGYELSPEHRFCLNCGRPVHQTASVPTPEADVPVPPAPRAKRAGRFGAAAARAPTQESGDRGLRHLLLGGGLVIIGLFMFAVILGTILGSGSNGGDGGKVAEKPQQKPAKQAQAAQEQGAQPKDEQEGQQTAKPAPGRQPDPGAKPITLTGSGPEATRPFQLESGLTVIQMKHQGNADFIVDLLDENGNSVAPINVVNVIGPFQGSTPVQIKRSGQYLLDVQNAGSWQIVVRQPRVESAPKVTTFYGNSAKATQLFELSGGLHRVEMTHQGDANFIVDLLDENGASVVPMGLVNEIGPFDGSRAMTVPDDGIYLFWVEANGPWTIKVD